MPKPSRRAWGQIKKRIGRRGQVQYQALSPETSKPRLSKLCDTRKEAEQALALMQLGQFQGATKPEETKSNPFQTIDSSSTLTTALQSLIDHPVRARSTKTIKLYQGFLNSHVTPTIGLIPLDQISYQHIQYCLHQMELAVPKFSPYTINAVRTYLRAEFSELRRQRVVQTNPVTDTEPVPIPPKQIVYWTREQITAIIEAAPHPEARAVLAIAAYLGCRAGEVAALRIQDYDRPNQILHIHHAVRWSKGQFELYPCKKHSQRSLPLVGDAGSLVIQHLEAHLETLEDTDPETYIFGQTPTRPRHETTFNFWHHQAIDRANELIKRTTKKDPPLIPHRKFHGTRSTTVTELRRQGASMESIQALMGHRDSKTTQNNYLAVDITDIAEALKRTTRKAK